MNSFPKITLAQFFAAMMFGLTAITNDASSAENQQSGDPHSPKVLKILADERLKLPLTAIGQEFSRRTGSQIAFNFLAREEVDKRLKQQPTEVDAALCMAPGVNDPTPLDSLAGAKKVAWKYPSGEPVWAVALTKYPQASRFIDFVGGPIGHRLWSESKAGFTIVSHTSADAIEWVAEHRVKHTYPMTAQRMLAECGGIRDGICIDIGCGPGHLDVELAKRSNFKIIGLDIDPTAKPLFEQRMRETGLEDRVSFVLGDAQQLPFPDNYADVIFSRGTLVFIPDIAKCLQEVDRVLKPTGVAFLGGRYLYTPQVHKISNEKLKEIVRESEVPGAQVIEARGQWVKIIGPEAPKAAHEFQGGPQLLAMRFIADYGIHEGKCLLICGGDGDLQQALQRGFVDLTELKLTALYPSEKVAGNARKRILEAKLAERIECAVGALPTLPFQEASFDLIAGVGPVLIWQADKPKAMREIFRVLRPGGAALIGGRYLGMPASRKVSSDALREAAAQTGIPSIRVYDDRGQWVEILKGIGARDPAGRD